MIVSLCCGLLLLLPHAHGWRLPLPGGKSISCDASGVIRLQLGAPRLPVPPAGALPDPAVRSAVELRDAGAMGIGAFAAGPLPADAFLGFYEGDVVVGRERLETEHKREGRGMDYVVALDGGKTFLDGYRFARDRTRFTPAHVNHAEGEGANVVRECDEGRVAFFTKREIDKGEQLFLDYGNHYWRGREASKI